MVFVVRGNPYIKEQMFYPWFREHFVTLSPVPGQSGKTGSRSLRGPLELEDITTLNLQLNCPK